MLYISKKKKKKSHSHRCKNVLNVFNRNLDVYFAPRRTCIYILQPLYTEKYDEKCIIIRKKNGKEKNNASPHISRVAPNARVLLLFFILNFSFFLDVKNYQKYFTLSRYGERNPQNKRHAAKWTCVRRRAVYVFMYTICIYRRLSVYTEWLFWCVKHHLRYYGWMLTWFYIRLRIFIVRIFFTIFVPCVVTPFPKNNR